jgi:hypothetical protein
LAGSDVLEKKIGKMLSDIRTRLSFDLTGAHAAIRLLPAHSEHPAGALDAQYQNVKRGCE